MSSFDAILSGQRGHTISDIASAIVSDVRSVVDAFGRPSALWGMTTHSEHYRRLMIGWLSVSAMTQANYLLVNGVVQ